MDSLYKCYYITYNIYQIVITNRFVCDITIKCPIMGCYGYAMVQLRPGYPCVFYSELQIFLVARYK